MQHLPTVPVFYEAHLYSQQRGHTVDLNMKPHATWVICAARDFHRFVCIFNTHKLHHIFNLYVVFG